jgi:hypothetical protein
LLSVCHKDSSRRPKNSISIALFVVKLLASQEKGYDQLVICKPFKRDGGTGREKMKTCFCITAEISQR